MRSFLIACGVLLAVLAGPVAGNEAQPTLNDPVAAKREVELAKQLRCLVCQNETIADSRAGLAVDLRNKLREQMAAGKSDEEIIAFMTERYGDFVLYRPPVKPITWLLWIGPLLILLGGGLFLWRRHTQSLPVGDDGMTEAEHQRLERLKSELLHKDES